MKLKETTKLCFCLFLYRWRDINLKKYNYNIPKNFNASFDNYYEKNKMVLNELNRYSIQQIKFRALINYFIFNNRDLLNPSDEQYNKIKDSVIHYKKEFISFLSTYNILTSKDLYTEYCNGNVQFFIFYYISRFVRFKESVLQNEYLKYRITITHKLMSYFTNFDEEYIRFLLKDLQKKIEMS